MAQDRQAQVLQQITDNENELGSVRNEIAQLSDKLRQLRVKEENIQQTVFKLKQQVSTIQERQIKAKVNDLQTAMVQQDSSLAELQAAYERALEQKLKLQEEMDTVLQQTDTPAGNTAKSEVTASSRYDLASTSTVMSGRSYDPLSQAAVPVVNHFKAQRDQTARVIEQGTRTIDQLGTHKTASPLVHPDELKQQAQHESRSPKDSARFSDWRRPGSRAQQPPGGRSQMSNIFG
eukprot:TRINITY_DN4293_c0_g1_i1.p1 TRINITY_DN4293_c0_g1~~TRINITY_DN4293_c0_g1_i1.p1  ORF type:complete len:234 (+),score=71.19 TRINITY_DN4293_c0_g1_i1:121-822(+)